MTIGITKVEPMACTKWLSNGFNLFKRSVLVWIVGIILAIIVALVLNLIPILGQIVNIVFTSSLGVMTMLLMRQIENTGKADWQKMLVDTKSKLGPILIVAVVNFGLIVVMAILMGGFFVAGGMAAVGAGGQTSGGTAAGIGAALGFGMLIAFVFSIAIGALNIFTAPLIAFTNIGAVDAMKLSINACIVNIVPLLVYSVISLVLYFIGLIPLGLGLLVVLPVLISGWYYAAHEIFPSLKE